MSSQESFTDTDFTYMRKALELAKRGIGRVSPNPLVGCVLVKDGEIIGEGAHLEFGGPHAEPNAIADAESRGHSVAGSTVYVTLEPHSHQGKTSPCSELLIGHKIARCVVAMQDPYPEVNGKGIAQLGQAGVQVGVGLCEDEARELNRFFITHVTTGRPYITLKIAQSLDGKSALFSGEPKWITGDLSRRRVHEERARHDAVLIGASTAKLDDPQLTVREVRGRQPWRIVLDARLELPLELRVFSDEYRSKTIVVTTSADAARRVALEQRGVTVMQVKGDTRIDLNALFQQLAQTGIASVLIEAGPTLAASVLSERLVDELQLFIAPIVLGCVGRPSFGAPPIESLVEVAPWLEFHSAERIGEDMLLRLRKIT